MKAVRSQSVSLMSQKLLEGYTMLAEGCPECGVPLLRKPGGGDTLCVNCTAEDGSGTAAASTQPAEQPLHGQGGQKPSGAVQQAASPCNGASSSPREGAAAEKEEENELLEAPPPLRQQLLQQGGSPAAAQPAAPQTAAPASTDSVSQRIADKMLEGWALLDEHCPRCQTPLVRSRQRRMYCVGCDMFAIREEDAQQEQQQQQVPHGQQQKQQQASQEQQQQQQQRIQSAGAAAKLAGDGVPAAGSGWAIPVSRPGSAGPPGSASLPPAPGHCARPMPSSPAAPALGPSKEFAHPGLAAMVTGAPLLYQPSAGDLYSALGQQLDTAAAAVGTRLQQASSELATADTQQAQKLVVLIQGCADALSALAGCKRKLGGK